MNIQNLATARQQRDAGMAQSFGHAERMDDAWKSRATAFLHNYALTHEYFTTEQMVIEATQLGHGSPSGDQAWGWIVRKAVGLYIAPTGVCRPRRRGHASPGPLWQSLVFAGVPA